ncbi:hypothetical protein COB21_02665 [Candidatus Aerophobetes bacterium]|uniref:Uncharacterized protein n=1 Tax=Aerophobetes bacterium TaxID=2030807 RepID=A0A2A4X544_UNCAE|nr:MAG: hypothetical protein COB21_02665 [Candidatus Aerophobetes bacterium]
MTTITNTQTPNLFYHVAIKNPIDYYKGVPGIHFPLPPSPSVSIIVNALGGASKYTAKKAEQHIQAYLEAIPRALRYPPYFQPGPNQAQPSLQIWKLHNTVHIRVVTSGATKTALYITHNLSTGKRSKTNEILTKINGKTEWSASPHANTKWSSKTQLKLYYYAIMLLKTGLFPKDDHKTDSLRSKL